MRGVKNFLMVDPVDKEKEILDWEPLSSFRFIRQRSGLKAQRKRKQEEKRWLKKIRHNQRGRSGRFNSGKHNKSQTASNQIQHGFDIAKKWREE